MSGMQREGDGRRWFRLGTRPAIGARGCWLIRRADQRPIEKADGRPTPASVRLQTVELCRHSRHNPKAGIG